MRILEAVKYDIRFQIRHGFYYAYLLVTLLYVLLLRNLPVEAAKYAASIIVFSDPSVLGFFFVGGIVLLERGQNIHESLFVTPLTVEEYIISKCLSLAFLGFISSIGIAVFSFGLSFNPLPYVSWVVLTSIFFTLTGLILAAYSKTLNGYLATSPILVVFLLPILEHINIFKTPIFYLLPGRGSLMLIDGAFKKIAIFDALISTGTLVLWIAAAGITANAVFYKRVVLGVRGEGK